MNGKIVQIEYAGDRGCLFAVTDQGELWKFLIESEVWQRIK